MKPGIRTSEFWLIAIVVLAVLAATFTRRLPAEYGTVISLFLPGFWAWLRAQAKMTPGTLDDEMIERLAPMGANEDVRLWECPGIGQPFQPGDQFFNGSAWVPVEPAKVGQPISGDEFARVRRVPKAEPIAPAALTAPEPPRLAVVLREPKVEEETH